MNKEHFPHTPFSAAVQMKKVSFCNSGVFLSYLFNYNLFSFKKKVDLVKKIKVLMLKP